MNFTTNVINGNIVHLKFNTDEGMCRTMVRFQEHYESPFFKGKIFTFKQFKRWYKWQKDGKYTYNSDWGGFNLPGSIFKPFLQGKFDPLTYGEQSVLKCLPPQGKNFYLIATGPGNDSLNHELAHAIWEMYPGYRLMITDELRCLPKLKEIQNEVLSSGYDEFVFFDELQAYMADGYTVANDALKISKHCTFREKLKYWLTCRMIRRTLKSNFSSVFG